MADLYQIDYLRIVTVTGDDVPLGIKIDGNLVHNPGRLGVEFVYPNMVVWNNGTLTNLFYMNTPEYNDQLKFSPYGSIKGEEYVINITQGNYQKIIARDINSGLLTKYHINYQNAVVTYERIDHYDGVYKEGPLISASKFNLSFSTIRYLVLFFPFLLYNYSKHRYDKSQ